MSSKYPTTMSCMDAFNRLTACYSLGGQFRSYYRSGQLNNCEKQLDKLKFCIFNGKDPIAVQKWYQMEAEKNKQLVGSTDLIWEERT